MTSHPPEAIDKLISQLNELDENIEFQSNGWQIALSLIRRDLRDLKKTFRS